MDSVSCNRMGYEPIMPYLRQVREVQTRNEALRPLQQHQFPRCHPTVPFFDPEADYVCNYGAIGANFRSLNRIISSRLCLSRLGIIRICSEFSPRCSFHSSQKCTEYPIYLADSATILTFVASNRCTTTNPEVFWAKSKKGQ